MLKSFLGNRLNKAFPPHLSPPLRSRHRDLLRVSDGGAHPLQGVQDKLGGRAHGAAPSSSSGSGGGHHGCGTGMVVAKLGLQLRNETKVIFNTCMWRLINLNHTLD